MASRAAFQQKSEKNHLEHNSLRRDLQALETALAELVCYSEVYANLASAGRVCECGRGLLHRVPSHFAQEETALLADVARMGPAAKAFVKEMKRQHLELQRQLEAFGATVEQLQTANDLEDAICRLKQAGEAFTRRLGAHMSEEERKIATLAVN